MAWMLPEDGGEHWVKPTTQTIKANVDAALFEESGSFSFCCVARDHNGSMIEGRGSCRTGRVSPAVAEAIGIREALSWIKLKPWGNIVLESDCLVAIQAIRSPLNILSYFGGIVQECRALLSSLKHISLVFITRSANKVPML